MDQFRNSDRDENVGLLDEYSTRVLLSRGVGKVSACGFHSQVQASNVFTRVRAQRFVPQVQAEGMRSEPCR